jgi:photosystem II stability/assembly factor-like uncharacterized protein
MNKEQRLFTPEFVDHDIDQLINHSFPIPSDQDAQLVHELSQIYTDHANLLKRVQERLECHITQNLVYHHKYDLSSTQATNHSIPPIQKNWRRATYPVHQRVTTLVATLISVFLVGSLAWMLAITHTATPRATDNREPNPMIAIRMLDTTHGWALTNHSILKTSDSGLHWQDVTPANSPASLRKGTFMNQNTAWVVSATISTTTGQGLFTVLHTSDGGLHWQSSQFSDGHEDTSGVFDPPHFINRQEGWLDVQRDYIMGVGTDNDVFHTIDGGNHWSKLASSEQIHQGAQFPSMDTGISILNAQTIWNTEEPGTNEKTGATTNFPVVRVTRDGGKTWQQQNLPPIPASTHIHYTTTPPVFFGKYGMMPVKLTTIASSGSESLSIYVTNDGGAHWSSRPQTPFAAEHVYILDQQHIWAAATDGSIYASQNDGQTWNRLGSIKTSAPFGVADMSFTNPNMGWLTTGTDVHSNGSLLLHTTDGGLTWQPINYSIQ